MTLGPPDTVVNAAPVAALGGHVPHRLGHGGQWVLCLEGGNQVLAQLFGETFHG